MLCTVLPPLPPKNYTSSKLGLCYFTPEQVQELPNGLPNPLHITLITTKFDLKSQNSCGLPAPTQLASLHNQQGKFLNLFSGHQNFLVSVELTCLLLSASTHTFYPDYGLTHKGPSTQFHFCTLSHTISPIWDIFPFFVAYAYFMHPSNPTSFQ